MSTEPYVKNVRVLREVGVPMRDGVRLATNVYLPKGEGPFPVVLVRMAYNRSAFAGYPMHARGLALVVQDTRGRYGSEGEFEPWVNEPDDGWDTLEWLRQQPWCNGRVGMFGASYLGGVQLAIAPLNHPNVVALNPSFIAGDLWRCGFYCDGAFSLALVFSWLCFEACGRVSEANVLPLFDIERLLMELPVMTIDEKSGAVSKYYREWVEHYVRDEYWERRSYVPALGKCKAPVMLTAGWYDYYPGETFRMFKVLLDGADSEEARRGHRILVGPWMHGINATSKLGELDYGEQATRENDSTDRWLEVLLKGGKPADFSAAPIRIFVMGENVWRDEHEWPLARTRWTNYYLHSRGRANTADGDGRLSTDTPDADEVPDRFTYDPANPVGTYGGNHSVGPYNPGLYELALPGSYDQKKVEARGDVLVYTSGVLEQDLEVTGPVVLKLFASTSAKDTDFTARLTDVYPDGRSMNITEGVIRARYRERQWDRPELLAPGKAYEFTIELQPTSNVFKKGHRLRLQISSSNFPLWSRNLNTGGHPGYETEIVVAEQTILHDRVHASHLILPVIPR